MNKLLIVLAIGAILGLGVVAGFEIHEQWTQFINTDHTIYGTWNVEDTGERWYGLEINIDSDTAWYCRIAENTAGCNPIR